MVVIHEQLDGGFSDVKHFSCATVVLVLTTTFVFTEYRMRPDDDGTRQNTGKETPAILFLFNVSFIVKIELRRREKPE